jgi:hypothetical protein
VNVAAQVHSSCSYVEIEAACANVRTN